MTTVLTPNGEPLDAVAAAQQALEFLCTRMGLSTDLAKSVHFENPDPVIAGNNRYGVATAAALGACAVGINALWTLNTQRRQDVRVDMRRCVTHGLRSIFLLRQNGKAFTVGGNSRRVNNFYLTRDGQRIYLLRMFDYPHIVPALLGVLKCENTPEAISAAVSRWNAHELEDALAEARAFGVIARSPEAWLQHPQGQWLAQRPGFEIRKLADSSPEPLRGGERPLAGLRVLDASHVIAGPATGRTLAEHGAEVLRVSAPHQPDSQQMVIDLGFGKRSAFLDLNHEADAQQMRRLATSADVFIESWRPGAMERRGLSPADLAAMRPGIVYVSLSCFGHEGPWRNRGGYEPIGQAVCGLSVQEGTADDPRTAPTVTMNDYLAAYLAAAGILGALHRRAREGGSYHVTTSLTQSSMWVLQQGIMPALERELASGLHAPTPAQWMTTTSSVFGELHHVAPIVEFSHTPAFWELAPQPFGASQPVWQTQ